MFFLPDLLKICTMKTTMKPLKRKKDFYSIKEIKAETGLSEDTLRYYEKDGILPEIHRLPNGYRQYDMNNLEWLKFVVCLRSTGMPLKKIRKYKELMEQGDSTAGERKELMLCHRRNILNEIETLNKALENINYKINYYDSLEI